MTTHLQKLAKVMLATGLLACLAFPVPPALAGSLLVTGQTTAYEADKNDGIVGPVEVPDDGTLQLGAPLKYKTQKDGTVKDLSTGLIWEVKCSGCGGLHEVANTYRWSGNGAQETIWDWLEDVNAEGGTGYAGRNTWRIPNRRELESLVDAELFLPSIDPIFGPIGAPGYWSSTTNAFTPSEAWVVGFGDGFVLATGKSLAFPVRAVRGGPQ